MAKIVYLMGKSATGKDTICRRLLEDRSLGLKKVIPYTTRPIRDGEREGTEYFFTDEAGYEKWKTAGKLIEERAYHTVYGLWRYFTADDGQMRSGETYLMIGTLDAYRKMQDYFGGRRMLPVMVELEDGIRLRRALDRECAQENPRYEELCRRFLADNQDFSEEKIREAGVTRRFVNEDLDRCLEEIKAYIKQWL